MYSALRLLKPAQTCSSYSQILKTATRTIATATAQHSRLRPEHRLSNLQFQRSYASSRAILPEFDLSNKTILVTGAARGLGLCMAKALLEAGATVYALDRLPPEQQSPDFTTIQEKAKKDFGTQLYYRQIDVRKVDELNNIVKSIADETGRMDGLIAAAGIQQETPAIDYSLEDANRMFEAGTPTLL